jgi:hypothetical protein
MASYYVLVASFITERSELSGYAVEPPESRYGFIWIGHRRKENLGYCSALNTLGAAGLRTWKSDLTNSISSPALADTKTGSMCPREREMNGSLR